MRYRGWRLAALAAVLVALVPLTHARADTKPWVIPPTAFGIHSFHGDPDVPAGSIRMNCSPPWYQVNPAPGVWDWSDADRRMQAADQWVDDVLYVFCGTPLWAAAPVGRPGEHWYGEGSNAPPTHMAYWRQYVTAIVDRYGDRIDAYQMWNEANSRFMWQGTPQFMARMTVAAAAIIRRRDPGAMIVSPSVQLTEARSHRQFASEYLVALARHGWPLDVVSFHTYVQGDESVSVRVPRARAAIRMFRGLGLPPRIQVWDTETNVLREVSRVRQAAYVARTFLDSWRSGVRRTYWYHYTFTRDDFVGIEMRPGDISEEAYRAMARWTVGSSYRGCSQSLGVIACSFTSAAGRAFRILYGNRRSQPYHLSRPARTCVLLADRCHRESGWMLVPVTPTRVSGR